LQSKRVANYKSHGGENLRYQYNLNKNSVVFDLGGYKGEWSSEIFARFQTNIYIFEPVKQYAKTLKNKYARNEKIKIFSFALSNRNKDEIIHLDNDSSSLYIKNGVTQNISLLNGTEFIINNNFDFIDLMKINIEGGEYDLLDNLIESGTIKKIKNIQVQFHDFVPDAENRMKLIQVKLNKTHHLTYQYEFVWENWEINN
jgi:FkbM family methyltransferase